MVKVLNSADCGSPSIINVQVRTFLLEVMNIKLYTYKVSISYIISSSFVCSFVYSCNNDLSVGLKDLDSNCTVQYCTEQYNSYYPGREHHAENKENFFLVY